MLIGNSIHKLEVMLTDFESKYKRVAETMQDDDGSLDFERVPRERDMETSARTRSTGGRGGLLKYEQVLPLRSNVNLKIY